MALNRCYKWFDKCDILENPISWRVKPFGVIVKLPFLTESAPSRSGPIRSGQPRSSPHAEPPKVQTHHIEWREKNFNFLPAVARWFFRGFLPAESARARILPRNCDFQRGFRRIENGFSQGPTPKNLNQDIIQLYNIDPYGLTHIISY